MERRSVVGLVVGPMMGASVAITGWSLLPSAGAIAGLLRFAAIGCACCAIGIWLGLLLTASPQKSAEDHAFIRTLDAGTWFYEHAKEPLKSQLRDLMNGLYETPSHRAESFVMEAIKALRLPLYGRRGATLKLEPVEYAEASPPAFMKVFGDAPIVTDLSIRRADLKTAWRYYFQRRPWWMFLKRS